MQNKEIEKDKQYFRKLSDTWKTMGNINEKASERLDNLLQYIEQLENKVKELEKENTDIKEVYIRTAKHLDKKGMLELSEYMLAQIEATPTFTTWEEYTTWISKQEIREKIEKLNKEYNEILSDYGNIDTDVTFNITNENVRKHLDELVIKIITLQELLEEK